MFERKDFVLLELTSDWARRIEVLRVVYGMRYMTPTHVTIAGPFLKDVDITPYREMHGTDFQVHIGGLSKFSDRRNCVLFLSAHGNYTDKHFVRFDLPGSEPHVTLAVRERFTDDLEVLWSFFQSNPLYWSEDVDPKNVVINGASEDMLVKHRKALAYLGGRSVSDFDMMTPKEKRGVIETLFNPAWSLPT